MASLCPAQLPGDLLKALLQSLFTLFMGCLRRNRQKEGCEKQKRSSLGAAENTALYMVILVTVVSGWWAKNKFRASDMVQLVKVLASSMII